MADPQNPSDPNKPDTLPAESDPPATSEAKPTPSPDDIVNQIASGVITRIAAGEPVHDVIRDTSQATGLDLTKFEETINAGVQAGDAGSGVKEAITPVFRALAIETRAREGKRELDSVRLDPDLGSAFKSHRKGFEAFLARRGTTFEDLGADPGKARRDFDYYLKTETTYVEDQTKAREETIRKEEREKIEKEAALRTGKPATPNLGAPAAKLEGGDAFTRQLSGAIEGSDEPTEGQSAVMAGLGFDEEKTKRAMESQAKKTRMGTPLDFIQTKNEGAVE